MKQVYDIEINDFPWFKEAKQHSQKRLEKSLIFFQCENGEILYEYGEKAEHVFFVIKGTVKIRNYSHHGDSIHIRKVWPGEYFGYVIDPHDAKRVTTAVANEASDEINIIGRINANEFIDIFTDDKALALDLMKQLNAFIAEHILARSGSALLDAYDQIILDLLRRRELLSSDCIEVPPRAEWASYLGLTRETLSRNISKLKSDGLIITENNIVHLVNAEELHKDYIAI